MVGEVKIECSKCKKWGVGMVKGDNPPSDEEMIKSALENFMENGGELSEFIFNFYQYGV